MEHLVASPCCDPDLTLDEAMAKYSAIGFRKFEAFTGWVKSALDPQADPAGYLDVAARHGMRFLSMHLPAVGDDIAAGVERSVRAARFARAIGAEVVLVKATSRPNYIEAAPAILDALGELSLTPVIQNHNGSPLTTVGDCREVLDGVADPRLKALLEVGHFHVAGIPWEEAYPHLRGRVALVHLKDIAGGKSVPFGTGEVDFAGLIGALRADGYAGDYVVELEDDCRKDTDRYLREAVELLRPLIDG
jgi:sugar phosphate isomerase/epimerase